MNNGSRILKCGSVELQSAKNCLNKKYYLFLSLIDHLDTVSAACAYISSGFWDVLLHILMLLSCHYASNFYVYENPYGLLFDASAKYICRNSEAEFVRLKSELEQIEIEIADLKQRHAEICRKLNSLEPVQSLNALVGEE